MTPSRSTARTGLRRFLNIPQDRSSTSPWKTRMRGVEAVSVTRSGLTPIDFAAISPASISPTSSLRWRARISEAPIAVARTRWVF